MLAEKAFHMLFIQGAHTQQLITVDAVSTSLQIFRQNASAFHTHIPSGLNVDLRQGKNPFFLRDDEGNSVSLWNNAMLLLRVSRERVKKTQQLNEKRMFDV